VRRVLLLLVVALLGLSCGPAQPHEDGAARGDDTGGGEAVDFRHGTAIIDMGQETALVEVEVAQSAAQRARGLMGRRSLPPDAGMAFVFFEKHRGGFWMKDTRIPLSIAFFGRDGRIVRILDMDPCREEPCELYDPGVPYWGALEVNQGAFERWGAEEGDVIDLVQ
jgi:uncharacterized protein